MTANNVLFVFDPGHGQTDPGCVNAKLGLKEKELTLDIAKRAAAYMTANYPGVRVELTRTSDKVFSDNKSKDLSSRAKFANDLKADYFVSFHINAAGGSGFESFVYTEASTRARALQNVIHKKVAQVFTKRGLTDRGQKSGNLAVVRETHMPAILIEYGFIDNARDTALLTDSKVLDEMAIATVQGIADAFGLNAAAATPALEGDEDGVKIDVVINGVKKDKAEGVAILTKEGRTFMQVAEFSGKKITVEKFDNMTKTLYVKAE